MEDVSAGTIKDERGDEEESEDVSENSTKKTGNSAKKSAKDDSTDVKLASMRCQDCGQQFTRWEAFKTHLRKHVLEEAMAEEEERRQSIKRALETNGSNGNVESAVPEKKQKNNDDCDYEENSDVDVEGDDEEFFDSSWQVRPSEIITVRPRVAMLSEEEKPVFSSSHRVYACSICGKVYSYLESFRNHQKTHEKEEKKQLTENKCPDCGKVFARPSLLVTHLKVHRPPVPMETSTLKCDQCVKNFNSLQTYLIHMDLHKQKPFWCLACAKGFRDELSLDKHLQGHNLRRHKCDICEKSFRVPAELRYHYNTHTGAKPYKCTLCKKNFSQLGNLITHRKKHVGVYVGASKTPLGPRKHVFAGRRRVTEMKRLVFTGMGSTEEAEVIDTLQEEEEEEEEEEEDIEVAEEKVGEEESGSEESESSSEDSGAEESSLGSESGSSKSDSSDSSVSDSSDDSDSSGSGVEEEEEEQEGKEETALEAHVAEQQNKHKEWECFECGEGFDQESALHLHYMKHASGELPVQ